MKCPKCGKTHRVYKSAWTCLNDWMFEYNHLIIRGVEIPKDVKEKFNIANDFLNNMPYLKMKGE